LNAFAPTRLRTLDTQGGIAYASGDDGRIYVKNTATSSSSQWTMKDAKLNGYVQQLLAFNENQFMVLKNYKIEHSLDGGNQWNSSANYIYHHLSKSEDGKTALAVGANVDLSVAVLSYFAPNSSVNFAPNQIQHIPLEPMTEQTKLVWHHHIGNGPQSKTIAAFINGDKIYRLDKFNKFVAIISSLINIII
jgi:hypothetical protein